MAQTQKVNGWDARYFAATEATFGTEPTPANEAAYAALAIEAISAQLGPSGNVGVVRPKQDRSLGRGMQSGFVEGRVEAIPFELQTSVKSRGDADDAPKELALYKAAGLKVTTNSSTSVVLSCVASPQQSGDFASATLRRTLGARDSAYESEALSGCAVRTLKWEGGDKEVILTASGAGVSKASNGALESITVLIGATSLTISAEESYRLRPGYYLCESEAILVTACTAGGTSATITRGVLGTSAAGHTTKPLFPLVPTGIAYSGSPIPETTCTVTIGGVTIRAMAWSVEFTTGLDMLPGETGSASIQGIKTARYEVKPSIKVALSGDDVAMLGKVTARTNVAVTISQGSGAGGVISFSMPYCEIEPISVPDTAGDISIVDISLRVRDDSAGNNAITITLT